MGLFHPHGDDTQVVCGVRGICQKDKLLATRAEVRLTRAFGSGEARQGADVKVGKVVSKRPSGNTSRPKT